MQNIAALSRRTLERVAMASHLLITCALFAETSASPWQYFGPPANGIVEIGTVRGLAVALPTHFHDEDQITFVLAGRRRFVIGGAEVVVGAGEGVVIPAGTPHGSLADLTDVACINLYAPPGQHDECHRILAALRDTASQAQPSPIRFASRTASPERAGIKSLRIGDIASEAGMTREGYSRRFHRLYGVAPQQFGVNQRLNEARRLLRAGEPIAEVAAAAGFADQSHLGRHFRHAFGVTPGAYRAGQAGSHSFQTITVNA